ncbi:hypothetical protein [Candidatus Poriferisodalis sp.]|uniref:hypothetical protein n=1 Tax=Candidatus Poriferisodalis sp. TaxID=3101277 RepID=UPI003AF88C1E
MHGASEDAETAVDLDDAAGVPAAASLMRYTAMVPKSSGTPHRRMGMRGITLFAM